MSKAKEIIQIVDHLKTDRSMWESYWQDIAKYTLPMKSYITRVRTPGIKLDTDVYDSTAITANNMLAAGLHGHLTNPAEKWFTLRMADDELMKDDDVREWLDACQAKMLSVINASNFYQQVHESYLDLGAFGTDTLYCEEDTKTVVRFYCRPVDEIYIVENEREIVEEVYRVFDFTARQAVGRFGLDKVSKVIQDAYKRKPEDKFSFIHAVTPRYIRNPGKKDSTNMPYSSIYIEYKVKKIVAEGGFEEFPFFVTRFSKASGEKYGYSPAMNVYPDVKMLNKIAYTIIRAAEKIVDPPLIMPHEGFLLPLRTKPGGLNYKLPSANADDKIEPLVTNGNIPVGFEMQDRLRQMIQQAFFVDLFLMMNENKQMTATEVAQRAEEKLILLGPVLGRLMTEKLDPIVERVFNIMARKGMFPPAPRQIQDGKMVVKYTSRLARAQKLAEANSLNAFFASIGGLIQVKPEIADKIDTDNMVDRYADIYDVPGVIIVDNETVAGIRQQRAEQQQQAMQLEAANSIANTIKTGTEADKNMREVNNG